MAATSSDGFRIERVGSVTSTNDLVRAAADRGEPEGLLVVAAEQTAGRGRHGRAWRSPPGNFYGSLLLRPRRPLPAAATLSLVAGLAVADAVGAVSNGRIACRLKWPNDVLVDGRKLAGILLEGTEGADQLAAWVVVGLGVNLVASPEGVAYPTTSLAELGVDGVTPDIFLASLLPALAYRLGRWRSEGFGGLRRDWLAVAAAVGELVQIRLGDVTTAGRFVDVDEHGALCLEIDGGVRRHFTAGELFFD